MPHMPLTVLQCCRSSFRKLLPCPAWPRVAGQILVIRVLARPLHLWHESSLPRGKSRRWMQRLR